MHQSFYSMLTLNFTVWKIFLVKKTRQALTSRLCMCCSDTTAKDPWDNYGTKHIVSHYGSGLSLKTQVSEVIQFNGKNGNQETSHLFCYFFANTIGHFQIRVFFYCALNRLKDLQEYVTCEGWLTRAPLNCLVTKPSWVRQNGRCEYFQLFLTVV